MNCSVTAGEVRWNAASARVDLTANAIHVWRVQMEETWQRTSGLDDVLAPDEIARRRAFRFEADRRRFTVARGMLRTVLGQYLNVHPRAVQFHVDRCGKPMVAFPQTDVTFNVSHSDDMALFAVGRRRRLGIDVERVRPVALNDRIPEQFFAPGEVRALRSLPLHSQRRAFFSCWTRKEAYLKARGDGLSFDLDRFEVSLVPGEPPALLWVHDEPAEPRRWAMVDLQVDPNYVGALIAETGGTCLSFHEWPHELTTLTHI